MKLRTRLTELAKAVADAAERDPALAARLEELFETSQPSSPKTSKPEHGRPRNRRPAAMFDPVVAAGEGEEVLRKSLEPLSVEQLKDIVADHGMDPGKLVMKWKDAGRIIDRIVEIAIGRAQKGNAFRPEADRH